MSHTHILGLLGAVDAGVSVNAAPGPVFFPNPCCGGTRLSSKALRMLESFLLSLAASIPAGFGEDSKRGAASWLMIAVFAMIEC